MSDMNITIDALAPGESGVVQYIEDSSLSERLFELGLVPGTSVICYHRAPLGDPSAYGIRGAVIALRREDGRRVRVSRGGNPDG